MGQPSNAPILVVEDDVATRNLLCLALEDEGFATASARDALLAAELMAELRPRLILLDLHMPGLDGGAFLEQLREDPRWKAIPVLVVSADSSIAAPGAQGVLSKPFDLNELLVRVRELLPAD